MFVHLSPLDSPLGLSPQELSRLGIGVVVLALAACGGGGDSATSTTAGSGSGTTASSGGGGASGSGATTTGGGMNGSGAGGATTSSGTAGSGGGASASSGVGGSGGAPECTADNVQDACGKDTSCQAFACVAGQCWSDSAAKGTPCAEDMGEECDGNGACLKKQGSACSANADCTTGHCVDGVCCDGACDAGCSACSAALGASADGTCTGAVVKGTFLAGTQDPGGCDDTNGKCYGSMKCTCDLAGACKIANGEASGDATTCASGYVVAMKCRPPAGSLGAGDAHTCALTATGKVRCWGAHGNGQLGYGNTNTNTIGDDEKPFTAGNVDVGATVLQLAVGGQHTCALSDVGKVRCWGSSLTYQLGYGTTNNIGDNENPSAAGNVNVGATVVQVAAGDAHTCALTDAGTVRCWGDNQSGKLGLGHTSDFGTPSGDVDVGATVVQLAAGDNHTCALTDTGKVRCWGAAFQGQLGYGNQIDIGDNEKPSAAGDIDVGAAVVQITASGDRTCALTNTGKVRCWGWGYYALNYGNKPSGDIDVGATAVQIAAGPYHICALTDAGKVRCWGYGNYGQLGYGNTTNTNTPSASGDVDVGAPAVQVVTGEYHTCALIAAGKVRCWGYGYAGRLGYGNINNIGDNEKPSVPGDVPYE